MRKPINQLMETCPFIMFTLALVLNYHVHLISVVDELSGLNWRWHSAPAKSPNEEKIQRWTDAHLLS